MSFTRLLVWRLLGERRVQPHWPTVWFVPRHPRRQLGRRSRTLSFCDTPPLRGGLHGTRHGVASRRPVARRSSGQLVRRLCKGRAPDRRRYVHHRHMPGAGAEVSPELLISWVRKTCSPGMAWEFLCRQWLTPQSGSAEVRKCGSPQETSRTMVPIAALDHGPPDLRTSGLRKKVGIDYRLYVLRTHVLIFHI
jgi:hypothetical protein